MRSARPGSVHAPLWPDCVKDKSDEAKLFILLKKKKNQKFKRITVIDRAV